MQWEAPSKLLAVDDPLLLPEREVHAEIGINWFLDQDIPSRPTGGYVKILAESLLLEERLDKTRMRTTEGLLHSWSLTDGGQSRAVVGNFYDHQRGQNYEHCKTSTKPLRDLKTRQ